MEKVFIQKIFQITERILRRDIDDDIALKELQAHLRKAEQMNFQHYEVEVLNTLGLLYSMQEDIPHAREHWLEALEKSEPLNEPDLTIKLLHNISELFLSNWAVDDAMQYAERGLSIAEQHNMKTITALYIHWSVIACLMARGQYAGAEEAYKVLWELSQHSTLQRYSRYEYAQIITLMHETRVQLDIVARDKVAYESNIKTFASFAEQMNRDDFSNSLIILGLYYALIVDKDDAAGHAHETMLLEKHPGGLRAVQLLPLTNFLFYNQQFAWARKYAQQIIDQAENRFVPLAVVGRAQEILKG